MELQLNLLRHRFKLEMFGSPISYGPLMFLRSKAAIALIFCSRSGAFARLTGKPAYNLDALAS